MPTRTMELAAPALTGRELEVLRLIGAGRTTREISGALGVSRRTVENHKRRIFAKLDVQSQAHAVASAARLGLLTLPSGGPGAPVVLGERGGLVERLERLLRDAHAMGSTAATPRPWRCWSIPARRTGARSPGWTRGWCWCSPASSRRPRWCAPSCTAPTRWCRRPAWSRSSCRWSRWSARLHAGAPGAAAGADRPRPRAGVRRAPLGAVATPREREILASIDRGESVKQTARSLGIAAKTVENLQGRLFRKLGVRNRAQAVAAAHNRGLLSVR